ncbi:MAG: hypothetical protein GY696_40410 [Gammaproteobacteria bacterium]|nr:hypothetical protein [Gammaproteobacteria bacterium]
MLLLTYSGSSCLCSRLNLLAELVGYLLKGHGSVPLHVYFSDGDLGHLINFFSVICYGHVCQIHIFYLCCLQCHATTWYRKGSGGIEQQLALMLSQVDRVRLGAIVWTW